MMDLILNNIGVVFLIVAVLWMVQFAAAYLQMRRFYGRLKEVRRGGLTAVGLGGGQYKGRSYAVLTVNSFGTIVHAEKFDGWTVFARLQPVPQMLGMSIDAVLSHPEQLPVSPKLQTAFHNAARDIQKARLEGKGVNPAPADSTVESVQAVAS
jgi:glucitol operon activator protein